MNATKSNTAKYEQYLDNNVKQIKKLSSQTDWVLNFLIYGVLIKTKLNVFSSAKGLALIFYCQDNIRVGSFRKPGSLQKLGSIKAPHGTPTSSSSIQHRHAGKYLVHFQPTLKGMQMPNTYKIGQYDGCHSQYSSCSGMVYGKSQFTTSQ